MTFNSYQAVLHAEAALETHRQQASFLPHANRLAWQLLPLDPERTITLCAEILPLAQAQQDVEQEILCLRTMVHMEVNHAHLATATQMVKTLLELARQYGDPLLYGYGLIEQAYADNRGMRFVQALFATHEAIEILQPRLQTGDPAIREAYIQALNMLALSHYRLGEQRTAFTSLEQALAVHTPADAQWLHALLLNNQAQCHYELGEWDAAQQLLEQALAICHRFRAAGLTPFSYVYVLDTLGNLRLARGQTEAAYTALNQGLEQNRYANGKVRDVFAHLSLLHSLATVDYAMQRIPQALTLAKSGLVWAQSLELTSFQSQFHQQLATFYETRSDFQQAFIHLEQHHDLERTALRQHNNQQILHHQAQQDMVLAQRESTLMQTQHSALNLLVSELEVVHQKLHDLTIRDALTDLLNRRFVDDYLEGLYALPPASRGVFSVALIDVDNFKAINDTFLHSSGDTVLITIATIFRNAVGAEDFAARFGGEEFMLGLVGGAATTRQRGESICHLVASAPWEQIHPDLHVTISMGVADTTEADDPMSLLRLADQRLYQAKARGKNQLVWH